nr:hypothetical protein Iba_chr09fCG10160 [Ipomoea batatas]
MKPVATNRASSTQEEDQIIVKNLKGLTIDYMMKTELQIETAGGWSPRDNRRWRRRQSAVWFCINANAVVNGGGGRSPAWLCVMAVVSWPGRSYRLNQSRSTNLLSGLSQRHCYCRGHDAVSSGGGRPPAWLGVVADVAAGVAASGSVDGGDWTAAAAGRDFTGVAAGGELTGIEFHFSMNHFFGRLRSGWGYLNQNWVGVYIRVHRLCSVLTSEISFSQDKVAYFTQSHRRTGLLRLVADNKYEDS